MDTAKTEISRLLSRQELSKSDVVNLMTQLRVCLEAGSVKPQFPHLNLYCNWAVHAQLSQSATAFAVIRSIADAITQSPNAPNSPQFWEDMTKAFGFDKLRSDCVQFSAHLNTPIEFFKDDDVWQSFVIALIDVLLERPLEFPDPPQQTKAVAAVFTQIQAKWVAAFKNTFGIKRVSFGIRQEHGKRVIVWSIDLIPGPTCISSEVTLRGPLRRTSLK